MRIRRANSVDGGSPTPRPSYERLPSPSQSARLWTFVRLSSVESLTSSMTPASSLMAIFRPFDVGRVFVLNDPCKQPDGCFPSS
jgi:hypothetical protein